MKDEVISNISDKLMEITRKLNELETGSTNNFQFGILQIYWIFQSHLFYGWILYHHICYISYSLF